MTTANVVNLQGEHCKMILVKFISKLLWHSKYLVNKTVMKTHGSVLLGDFLYALHISFFVPIWYFFVNFVYASAKCSKQVIGNLKNFNRDLQYM